MRYKCCVTDTTSTKFISNRARSKEGTGTRSPFRVQPPRQWKHPGGAGIFGIAHYALFKARSGEVPFEKSRFGLQSFQEFQLARY